MRICYVIASRSLSPECAAEISARGPGAFVVCADGGLLEARRHGITPDMLVGDMDSLGEPPADLPGVKVVRYAAEKDDTDGMLAVKEALRLGHREFMIYGALGGRLDHTLGNLCVLRLIADMGGRGWLRSDDNCVTLLRGGEIAVPRREGFYISLVPLFGTCKGVSIYNVKYPLDGVELSPSATLGISNEFSGEQALVACREGDLIIILSRKT